MSFFFFVYVTMTRIFIVKSEQELHEFDGYIMDRY